jgi:hypothetical protein
LKSKRTLEFRSPLCAPRRQQMWLSRTQKAAVQLDLAVLPVQRDQKYLERLVLLSVLSCREVPRHPADPPILLHPAVLLDLEDPLVLVRLLKRTWYYQDCLRSR